MEHAVFQLSSATRQRPRPRLAIVLDPRFSGGTCSAVAREIDVLAEHVDIQVFALETRMFKGRTLNPRLAAVLERHGIDPVWNPAVINCETIAIHNPSALKFETEFAVRMVCRRAYIVTHENFVRPAGGEGFDVARCLGHIERQITACERYLAPVSGYNRRNVGEWVAANRSRWRLSPFDWFNICDFPLSPPTAAPRDRRGRLSRPGFEKFPDMDTMARHFPPHAEACIILGGDTFLLDPETVPEHWRVLRFGEMPVDAFFEGIDFFVYYTHPLLRESFGRVIPEAIAAGKLVITDPNTAETFGEAVVASEGHDVDAIVASFVADPERYRQFVLRAQDRLSDFGAERFVQAFLAATSLPPEPIHAHL